MRLLNAVTKRLESFRVAPPYAILSHRWGDARDEITFQDIDKPYAPTMKGYSKVNGCCSQALKDGLNYVWIDTCCIDKSSSAELSEAINSMYIWYQDSDVCYVYLDDVLNEQNPDSEHSQFSASEWFSRGWTLQELIAPEKVVFFAKDWVRIGTRDSLMHRIEQVTGIDSKVLEFSDTNDVSVAQRMFWAARRETTRVEDRAYSLLGLFAITMPAIYGEGRNAFKKLQLEIMRTSDDQSLFAWTTNGDATGAFSPFGNMTTGLLAASPSQYSNVDEIPFDSFVENFVKKFTNTIPKPEFSVTNGTLYINLPIKHVEDGVYKAMLRCSSKRHPGRPLCIYLQKIPGHREQFSRRHMGGLEPLRDDEISGFYLKDVYIREMKPSFPRGPVRRRARAADTTEQVALLPHSSVPRSPDLTRRRFSVRRNSRGSPSVRGTIYIKDSQRAENGRQQESIQHKVVGSCVPNVAATFPGGFVASFPVENGTQTAGQDQSFSQQPVELSVLDVRPHTKMRSLPSVPEPALLTFRIPSLSPIARPRKPDLGRSDAYYPTLPAQDGFRPSAEHPHYDWYFQHPESLPNSLRLSGFPKAPPGRIPGSSASQDWVPEIIIESPSDSEPSSPWSTDPWGSNPQVSVPEIIIEPPSESSSPLSAFVGLELPPAVPEIVIESPSDSEPSSPKSYYGTVQIPLPPSPPANTGVDGSQLQLRLRELLS